MRSTRVTVFTQDFPSYPCEFKASLDYLGSPKAARVTWGDPLSKKQYGARENAQWLRPLVALAGDLGLIPRLT